MRKPILLSVVLLNVVNAHSASADDLFNLSLEELLAVEVSSVSYFKQTILDASSSISIIDEDRWQDLSAQNIGELLNFLPSTIAAPSGGMSRLSAVRGYFRESSSRGTAIRFDGVPMNKIRESTGLMDVDGYDLNLLSSVEQIRGTGSALHGNDAFHSVLSLNSFSSDVDVTKVNLLSGQAGKSSVAVKTRQSSAQHSITAGTSYRDTGDANAPYQYYSPTDNSLRQSHRSLRNTNKNALLKYQWQANEQLSLQLTAYALDFDAEQPGIGKVFDGYWLADKDWVSYQSKTELVKAEGRYQWAAQSSFEVSAYRWNNDDEFIGDFNKVPSIGFQQISNRDEYSQGLSASYKTAFTKATKLAIGFEFRENVLDDIRFSAVNEDGDVVVDNQQRQEAGYERQVKSLVLDGRHRFADWPVEVFYGLRYDDYSDGYEQTSPKLGLVGEITPEQRLKFIFGQAFRAPALFEIYGSNIWAGNVNLEPETIESYEIIHILQHDIGVLTSTLFVNNWHKSISQQLYEQPDVNGLIGQFDNVGDNRAYGIESEWSGRWQNFKVDGFISLAKSENIRTEQTDKAFPYLILGVGLGYLVNDSLDIYWHQRFHAREHATVSSESAEAKHYLRSDLALNQKLSSHWRLSLKINNLFDRTNYLPAFRNVIDGFSEQGRNVSLSLEWQW